MNYEMRLTNDDETCAESSEFRRFSDNNKNYVPISKCYEQRSVFITGGTGFLGKVLVEKLLRSCSDIKNIYLLIRPKQGKEVSTRLNEILNSPIFALLRRDNPEQLKKLIPIKGDISAEELGISEIDQTLLCSTVSIVFHSAATVNFAEKLKVAVTLNILGTKRVIDLCHRMPSLVAVLHVSTAYINCVRSDISEVIFPPPHNPIDIISLIKWMPDELLDGVTTELLGTYPNTYTFTKALTEYYFTQEIGNLPAAIVRPSIVTASLKEPFPGWVDSSAGASGMLAYMGLGMIRTFLCPKGAVCDMIPVDIVINLIIATAWHTALKKSNKLLVFNCCSGASKPITFKESIGLAIINMRKLSFDYCFWYPKCELHRNHFIYKAYGYVIHYIPAYVVDVFTRLLGRKPTLVRIQRKIYKTIGCIEYFLGRQWRFSDGNVKALANTMSPTDREMFSFDVRNINWKDYMATYVFGIRTYLMQQEQESIPRNRKRMIGLFVLDKVLQLSILTFTITVFAKFFF